MQDNIQDSAVPSMADVSEEMPSHGPSAPSASQSRRAKNAASRANDVGEYVQCIDTVLWLMFG